jgi:hypothetical protein
MPRVQGFLTVGHLYRGIEQGLSDLASRLGEPVLFVGGRGGHGADRPGTGGATRRFGASSRDGLTWAAATGGGDPETAD